MKKQGVYVMNWIQKLERRFGRYAIPNLMIYVIGLYVVGFLLDMVNPAFYETYLSLNAGMILQGQVWRLVTFLIQPPDSSLLFVIFSLYLYYFIGRQLEYTWGTFRFNLYFFVGVFFHILAAFIVWILFRLSLPLGTYYINMSLFLAFAFSYPDEQFLLFFVIPIKAKWLGYVDLAYFGYTILQAFLPAYGGSDLYGVIYKANALAAFVSMLNFLLFYFSSRDMKRFRPKEVRRRQKYRREVQAGRESHSAYAGGAKHRCAVCGRTEADDPTLEFRYCSKCNGNYEYCQDHLFTHEHIK